MRIPFFKSKRGGDPVDQGHPSEKEKGNLPLHSDEEPPPPAYSQASTPESRLQIHPIPAKNAVLVKVQPPREPEQATAHVPCDIVLVIDVSGSMDGAAPVPGDDGEDNGLSILDLVKHATNTIITTCDERDRVGIVKYSDVPIAVLPLTTMTRPNREMACGKVKNLVPENVTNLWGGIQLGLTLFDKTSRRVPAMMVLTDGLPNHMCPPQGYVPKLRTLMPLPATIHTFGFGYSIRSGLLKSIAEIGGGNFGFIPDAGMIGTVFNHAVANLQSTYAMKAVLQLTYAQDVKIEETTGVQVDTATPMQREDGLMELCLPLGNLQFGQSRDIYLAVHRTPDFSDGEKASQPPAISATLTYLRAHVVPSSAARVAAAFQTTANLSQEGQLSEAEIAYHETRSQICNFIASLYKLRPDMARTLQIFDLEEKLKEFDEWTENVPARAFANFDDNNAALIEDLCGDEPHGQVRLALSSRDYFSTWGVHYLQSYLNAHTRQIGNSFKDLGAQRYGLNSPLFQQCLASLDRQFDLMPPPEPSRILSPNRYNLTGIRSTTGLPPQTQIIPMSAYNNASGPCFAGSTAVELASGKSIAIKRLRRGMRVNTPLGLSVVAFVLKTPVEHATLCRMGRLLVTPWHPISRDGGKTWVFPASVATSMVRYTGAVYSIMLKQDARSDRHAIRVEDCWGVTLGHGLTTTPNDDDIRGHEFWGDWARVSQELKRLGVSRGGLVIGKGVERDEATGLVTSFRS